MTAISDYNAHSWIKIHISEKAMQTIAENQPDFVKNLEGNVKIVANPKLIRRRLCLRNARKHGRRRHRYAIYEYRVKCSGGLMEGKMVEI